MTIKKVNKKAMNKKLSITTDNPALYGLLNSDLPYGVKIVSKSPYKGRSFEISRGTDIKIVADFEAIEKDNFVAWLISRTRVFKGDHKMKINQQKIPINSLEVVKLITEEINIEK
jgi:hypothetical protein